MNSRRAALALFAVTLCGCQRPNTVVRFGYKPTPGQLLGVVAVKEGFFHREQLDVAEVVLPTGQQILEAAVAGRVDVGLASSAAVIAAYSAGATIRVIAGSSYGGGRKRLLVLEHGPYRRMGDLVGKQIAVATGGVALKEFLRSLAGTGYSERDFEIISRVTDTDLGALLVSRTVDAIVCVEPICSKLEFNKVARELSDFRSVGQDPNSLFASVNFIESHPQQVTRLLRAWLAAEGYVKAQRPQALRLLSNASGDELAVIELACARITYDSSMTEILLQEYQADARLLLAEGKIRSSDLSGLFLLDDLNRLAKDAK